jgi:hypothetical protein
MSREKIVELQDEAIKQGASKEGIHQLIDEVGKFATQMAVEATSKLYVSKIKEAAELGKAEYEAKLKEEQK